MAIVEEHQEEAERIIASINSCVDRGVDPESGKRGKCHVFLSGSDKCVCGDVDLSRERMK